MKNVTSRKMFRKTGRNDARNQLRRLGGIMSSSPELMDTVQKFNLGGPVGNRRAPTLAQLRGPKVDRSSIRNRFSLPDFSSDPYMRNPGRLFENYLFPETRVRDTLASENVGATGATLEPRLDLGSVFSSLEDDVEMIASTEDLGATGLTQSLDNPEVNENETLVPGTVPENDDAGDPTLPVTSTQQRPQKPDPSESMPDPSIDAYGLQEQINIGNNLRKDLAAFLRNPNASEKEKNDAGLEFAGYKKPEEELSVEKRAEANVEMFRRLMGRDPEEDKKIDGYNLAMLGFLIASGDSPNALQNIARGAAAGVKNFQDTAKARQAREEKLKMAGIEKAFRDDETAKRVEVEERRIRQGYQFQTFTAAIESSDRKVELATRLGFEKVKLEAQLAQQLELAKDQNISAEKRAELQANATMTSGLIKSLGSIATVALGQSDGTPEGLMKSINDVLNNPQQMEKVKEIEALTNQSKLLGEKTPSRERADMRTTAGVAENVSRDAEDMLAETGVSSPTVGQRDAIERLLRYYRSTETPLPPTTMQRSDGTVVRLVGMDDDNKPIYTDEPVGQ